MMDAERRKLAAHVNAEGVEHALERWEFERGARGSIDALGYHAKQALIAWDAAAAAFEAALNPNRIKRRSPKALTAFGDDCMCGEDPCMEPCPGCGAGPRGGCECEGQRYYR